MTSLGSLEKSPVGKIAKQMHVILSYLSVHLYAYQCLDLALSVYSTYDPQEPKCFKTSYLYIRYSLSAD